MTWQCRICNCTFVQDEVCVTCGAERLRDNTMRDLERENERLRRKCDMQAKILQSLTPDRHPDILFIHAQLGEKDSNRMPERLLVVPAYGVDFSYVYQRTDKTTGPEW